MCCLWVWVVTAEPCRTFRDRDTATKRDFLAELGRDTDPHESVVL